MEKAKQVLNFLLLKPAMSSRNLTSIALVALFFGVYVAAGGKISSIPQIDQGSGFGTVKSSTSNIPTSPIVERSAQKETESSSRGELFEFKSEQTVTKQVEKTKPKQVFVEKETKTKDSDLEAIQERLKRLSK